MADDGRAGRGRAGEAFAQNLLERNGYCIVDVNVRFGKTSGLVGELDIVAWDGPTLCFVEVKTRRGGGGAVAPVEAVTPAKQRQIARLALAYANRHGLLAGSEEVPLRFDVVSVVLSSTAGDTNEVRRADILRGAFFAPDNLEDGWG
jgi:putative endonuclease